MLSLQVTVLQTVSVLPIHPGCEPSLGHAVCHAAAEIVAELSLRLFLAVCCIWPALTRRVN